jgi:hypothetical protein
MPENGDQSWALAYRAALLELNLGKLPARVEEAYQAVRQRMAELSEESSLHAEKQALADALQNLRLLEREFGREDPGPKSLQR